MRAFSLFLAVLGGAMVAQGAPMSFLEGIVPLAPGAGASVTPCSGPTCGCAQFSGTWVGVCTQAGSKSPQSAQLQIEQEGCHHITVNGDALAVGGAKTLSLTLAQDLCDAPGGCHGQASTEAGESSADWNSDNSVLTVEAHSGGRSLGRAKTWRSFSGTLKLAEAHLLVDAKGAASDGAQSVVSCSFEK